MAQASVFYLIGALIAFSTFALTLFAVSIYARPPHPLRATQTPEAEVRRRAY